MEEKYTVAGPEGLLGEALWRKRGRDSGRDAVLETNGRHCAPQIANCVLEIRSKF